MAQEQYIHEKNQRKSLQTLTCGRWTGHFIGMSFGVNATDPATGQDPGIRFDVDTGRAINVADTSNPAYFQTIEQYYNANALARGALAPLWEVATAKQQAASGLGNAGLSEVERAANQGHLAAKIPTTQTTEHFNPIAIHLNGDGQLTTVAKANSNVLFDIDGTADLSAKLQGQTSPHYLKRTSWLNNQDGYLVLDKNINGSLDNGEEMFSNSKVNEQHRGVASLAVIDGDGNGKIYSSDAVFNNLVVWQDANGNGRMDDGEGKALAALGISSLNYEAGTVTRNGQATTQMHTLTLDADTLGTSFTPKGDGIVLQTTDGQTTLQVTKLRRLGEQVIVALDDAYLENDSSIRPYDADIGAKNLKNWSAGDKTGRKPIKPRFCVRARGREKQRFQEKTKQCHRHMVILCSEKYSKLKSSTSRGIFGARL